MASPVFRAPIRGPDYFGQGSWGWLRLYEKGGSATTSRLTTRPRPPSTPNVEPGRLEKPKVALFQTVERSTGSSCWR